MKLAVSGVLAQIIEVISRAQAAPRIQVSLEGSRLTVTADLGRAVAANRVAAMASEVGVSEDAVLRVLERKKVGFNLASLARSLDLRRKTALKPLLERMIASGSIEKAAGSRFRIPGRVRRGRKPGTAKNEPAKVTAAPPKPANPPKRPAVRKPIAPVKPAKPVAKTAPAKKRVRKSATKKAAPVTASTTPVANEPPADAPPVADGNVAATAEDAA